MQPKLLHRIAAIVMLLHAVGHSIGALTWSQTTNPRMAAVISSMTSEHFIFMGHSATLAKFYNGYGIIMIFVLLLITIQLWLLSSRPAREMQVSLGVFLVLQGVAEYIYFFPFAALFSGIAGILAVLSARNRAA